MNRFDPATFHFSKVKSICTDREKKLYDVLSEDLNKYYPNQYILFPKVKLIDIIGMGGEDKSTQARARVRHVDFLICKKDSLEPTLVIELQDNYHKGPRGKYKDAFLKSALENANLPLLPLWNNIDIYSKLKKHLSIA